MYVPIHRPPGKSTGEWRAAAGEIARLLNDGRGLSLTADDVMKAADVVIGTRAGLPADTGAGEADEIVLSAIQACFGPTS